MRISEFKGAEGLEVLSDLLEPIVHIMADKQVLANILAKNKVFAVKYIGEKHAKDALAILARCNNVAEDEYTADAWTIAEELFGILTDDKLMDFFGLQGQTLTKSSTRTGSAMANTKATGRKSKTT